MFSGAPTKNYGLPQWEFDNHPSFINDFNPAFEKIDTELGVTAGKANDAQDQLAVLSPLVTQHGQTLETQAGEISQLQVGQINQEHINNDMKQNIAQNTADIAGLQQEDHNIHETADADRVNFYKVLNLAKLNCQTVTNITVTIQETTYSGYAVYSGNIIYISITFPANTTLPSYGDIYEIKGLESTDIPESIAYSIAAVPVYVTNLSMIIRIDNKRVYLELKPHGSTSPNFTTEESVRMISILRRPSVILAENALATIPPQVTNSIIEPQSGETEVNND